MKIPPILTLLPFLLVIAVAFTSCSLLDSGGPPDIPGKIVFAATDDDDAGTSQIYSMNANGTGLKQLTDGQAPSVQPAWSPDGEQIIFSSFSNGSTNGPGLSVMNADGSEARFLYQLGPNQPVLPGNRARFSPDGSQVVFDLCLNCSVATNFDTYLFDREAKTVTQLTDFPGSDTNPIWSPDGSRIAFVSNRDNVEEGGSDIYLMDFSENNIERLTQTGNAGRPFWFSNSNALGYWSENNLYKLNFQNMNSEIIPVELEEEDHGFRPFQIVSNRKYILLHIFNLANPREEQTLQILNLDKNKLTEIYRNDGFNGADWFLPSDN